MRRDLLAEFTSPEALLGAVRACRQAGLAQLETFTPFPIRDVQEALDLPRSRIPLFVFVAGIAGAVFAFCLQWWMNGLDYPLNVGGRPLESFPAFVPMTFEGGVFAAAAAALVGLLLYAGLPRLWHPVFEVEGFERASIDRFFLRVAAGQPGFDEARVRALCSEAGAERIETLGGGG